MDFEVRYAVLSDLPQVNVLRKQINDLHANGRPDIFRDDFCDAMQKRLYDHFAAEDSDVIVAVQGETVCGFAMVEYIRRPESPYCHPRSFYRVAEFGVDAAFRRQGIATALIAFCREEARKKGFLRMELDMWEFNEGALKFYESVGFRTYRRYMEQDIE